MPQLQMNKYLRRAIIGMLAGGAGGVVLARSFDHPAVGLGVGVLVGVLYAVEFAAPSRVYADVVMTAASFGVPLWTFLNIVVLPILIGESPRWTAAGMRAQFPALVGWVLYGVVLGLLVRAFGELATRLFGAERTPAAPAPTVKTRVVILGGGFAGVTCAENLERQFGADASVEITLVSETNALLFTPMLAEVAASSLEATHISTPLRSTLRRTRVVRGRVVGFDLDARQVQLASDARLPASTAQHKEADNGTHVNNHSLPYDHLVLALGAVSNYLGMKNVKAAAFDFKSLADAIRIRNHVIDCFERADAEPDAQVRRAFVTFVVAGGGYAGAELAGGVNDFARGMLALYPNVAPEEVGVVLIHSRERILPEMSAGLADYALKHMEQRGVRFKLKTRLADARPGVVVLDSGEEIKSETLVWTAGTAPHPLLQTLPVERDKRGAVVVEATLAVPGQTGLWALGDCAQVPDAKTGKPCPPTAQFALREARTLARNLRAQVHGQPLKAFHFDSLGQLCVVGHQTACAEIKGLRFSGFFAWLMWRGIYLGKLPGLERKVRVLADWIIEVFFPRDIVQTIDTDARPNGVGTTNDEARADETNRMSEAKGAYAGS